MGKAELKEDGQKLQTSYYRISIYNIIRANTAVRYIGKLLSE